jgi:ATP phosphoribosyltransferase regulatory subunit
MIKQTNSWILPAGIEEVLPPDAYEIELLCRRMLDQFDRWGYDLVLPPLIEYLDSLLTGTGEDLDLKTFKITDQLSGKMMGIRADMTPQVARIDSNILKHETPTRLCYFGTTLHTRPRAQGGTRSPLQVGAELFGHAGVESDAEILVLMLKTLEITGVSNVHVDIGHMGIYRRLVGLLGITPSQEAIVYSCLQRKATPELRNWMKEWSVAVKLTNAVLLLTELHGDVSVLDEARVAYKPVDDGIVGCIDELGKIAERVTRQSGDASLLFDLADLRGYKYHNGMMFTTYMQGQGQGIAFGGRYDGIGREFGRSRPATGFSADVKLLYDLADRQERPRSAIFAPASNDTALSGVIAELRNRGERVVAGLPGQTGAAVEMQCDRELYQERGQWQVRSVTGDQKN